MPSWKQNLRRLYRGNSHHYPAVYNFQQRATVALRARFGILHEIDFQALRLLNLPDEAVCVDIGANCGQSIASIKKVLPDSIIAAFEPNPQVQDSLARTASRFASVTIHKFALDSELNDGRLYVPECRGVHFHQLASLEMPDVDRLLQDLRTWGFGFASRESVTFSEQPISTRRLDDFGLRPDFIKIDVEGGELGVLVGAELTLHENAPVLLIEHGHRTEIAEMLGLLGYSPYTYKNGSLQAGHQEDSLNSFFIHTTRIGNVSTQESAGRS